MTAKKLPVYTATMRNGFTLGKPDCPTENVCCSLVTAVFVVAFVWPMFRLHLCTYLILTLGVRRPLFFPVLRLCLSCHTCSNSGMHSSTTYDISPLHNENDQYETYSDREEFMLYMAGILWQCALHGTSKAGQNKQRWTSNEVKCTESVTCFASIGIDQCA